MSTVISPAPKLTPKQVDSKTRDLIRSYRQGKMGRNEAFAEIVPLIHPPITTTLRYVYCVRTEDEQDDLFQEFMLRFVQRSYDHGLDRRAA